MEFLRIVKGIKIMNVYKFYKGIKNYEYIYIIQRN